jgi:hypothetical protein
MERLETAATQSRHRRRKSGPLQEPKQLPPSLEPAHPGFHKHIGRGFGFREAIHPRRDRPCRGKVIMSYLGKVEMSY